MRTIDQGPKLGLRLGFRKLGRVAFNSHLDLVKHLPRIFRRVGLPLYFSEGYRPTPQMSFSPALALGVSSLGEYLDLKLRARDVERRAGATPAARIDPLGLDALLEALNDASLEGLEFFGLRVLGPHDEPLGRVLDEAEYVAGVPRTVLAELGLSDEAALAARIDAKLGEPRLVVRRTSQGIGRDVDVKKSLLALAPDRGYEALAAAGLTGDLVPLSFALRLDPAGTAKGTEVLSALFDRDDVPARLVRTGLFARRHALRLSPLDLEALRAPRAEPFPLVEIAK
jgi:hypothetical protein